MLEEALETAKFSSPQVEKFNTMITSKGFVLSETFMGKDINKDG